MSDEDVDDGSVVFVVSVGIRMQQAVADSTLDIVGRLLRPDDPDMCVFRDDQDPAVLRVDTEVRVRNHHAAVAAGRALGHEVLKLVDAPAAMDEIVSMTEVDQMVWRP